MLNGHTLQQRRALRLDGRVAALTDAPHLGAGELSLQQRLALLLQREVDWRDAKCLRRDCRAAFG